jgi:N-dimethylarginine dimethylaminohydrolase
VRGIYTELTCFDAPREPVILNGGALVGRAGIASKRGLEMLIARRLMSIGCPILYTVHGKGSVFEAGNVVWLDERHVMIGCGVRTSLEAIREVEPVLRLAGVEDIHVAHLPGYLNFQTDRAGGAGGFYHLDMVFGMVDERLGVIYPAGVGYETIRYLKSHKIDLIEVPLDEVQNYACNLLAVRPGRVIATAGNPRTREALEKSGVEVLEMCFEGGKLSGRGPVCSTLPLVRDTGPQI